MYKSPLIKGSVFSALLLLLIILFWADLLTGNVELKWGDILRSVFFPSSGSTAGVIFYNFRLPKALTAVVAGAALGISGLLTQTYFRNPLAGPDVLGVSAGASMGVAIVVLAINQFFPAFIFSSSGSWTVIIAACIGAGLTMLVFTLVSGKIRDNVTLLVLGLMVGAVFSSIITIMQYVSSEALLKSFVVWGFGSIRHLSLSHLAIMFPFILAGIMLAFLSIKSLNALLIGERYAQTLGIHVLRSRLIIFLSIILLAGTITAFCGPIAFVAITVPHISRILFRTNDHLVLIPASMLTGSIMLLISDLLSQLPGNLTLPINALTSIMGIPLIIWIVLRKKMW